MRLDPDDLRASAAGSRPSLLSQWRVGAVIPALAVRDEADRLWLQIAGQRLAARLATPNTAAPAHGALLQLQVLRTSPVLAVKVLADPSEQARRLVLDEALRRHLPRQDSPAPLLANLQWLSRQAASSNITANQLPQDVLQAAQRLWQALPQATELTDPQHLRRALQNSGLFLENTLTRSGTGNPAAVDIKSLLLTLLQTLKAQGAKPAAANPDHLIHAPIPDARVTLQALRRVPATLAALDEADQQLDELARQSEGALARVTCHQLASAETGASTLLMELPLRHEHQSSTLRLRIEREPRGKGEDEDGWSVEAAMDLGVDGALHARVHLRGKRVGVQLRAESPALQSRLAASIEALERLLQQAGLQPEGLICLHGVPATHSGGHTSRLLDMQA